MKDGLIQLLPWLVMAWAAARLLRAKPLQDSRIEERIQELPSSKVKEELPEAPRLPPPVPSGGIDFRRRNKATLDFLIDGMINFYTGNPSRIAADQVSLARFADELDYYGLFDQALRIREIIRPSLRFELASMPISPAMTMMARR